MTAVPYPAAKGRLRAAFSFLGALIVAGLLLLATLFVGGPRAVGRSDVPVVALCAGMRRLMVAVVALVAAVVVALVL